MEKKQYPKREISVLKNLEFSFVQSSCKVPNQTGYVPDFKTDCIKWHYVLWYVPETFATFAKSPTYTLNWDAFKDTISYVCTYVF
jgi:hypothetical protein